MHSQPRRLLALVALACCLTAAAALAHGDDPAALARRVRELVESIQSARADYRAARDAHREAAEKVRKQLARLEFDRDAAQERVRALRERLAGAEADIERLEAGARADAARLAGTAAACRTLVDGLESSIAGGIPWRVEERLATLRVIDEGLARDEEASRLQALSELFAFLGEELRAARQVQLLDEPIRIDEARTVPAFVIRLGLVAEYYLSEDGQHAGASVPAGTAGEAAWTTELRDEDETAIRDALDILRRRAPPKLVPLPVHFRRPVKPILPPTGSGR